MGEILISYTLNESFLLFLSSTPDLEGPFDPAF